MNNLSINTFDIDGVIFINKEVGGVHPGPHDVIITGRSYEEKPETEKMLRSRGIINTVMYNEIKFDEKTRESSGYHKARSIKALEAAGYRVMCHFEDDDVQAKVINHECPEVHVIRLVHDLTEKENVRHDDI